MFSSSKTLPSLGLVALVGLASARDGCAQDAAKSPLAESILRDSFGASFVDGRVVGIGPDYRAEFDATGIEFIPALGRSAPTTLPLRLTFESVSRDEGRTWSARSSEPALHRDRVSYARGHGVTERFDMRRDGVEQSFEFVHPLEGRGDLVVRCRTNTELEAPTGVFENGVAFASPHGSVTIGAVTGIDADGARVTGSLRHDGEHLDFVLPARFVDAARYPLILDPIIGAAVLDGSGSDDSRVDIAYEGSFNNYCVVWERALAGDTIDIRARRTNTGGAGTGAVLLVKSGGVNVSPTIASIRQTGTFIVAWQAANGILGPYDLETRTIAAANGQMSSNVVPIGTQFQDNDLAPDLGGNRTASTPDGMLVWQVFGGGLRGCSIRAALPPADPIVGVITTLTTNALDAVPAISKSGGDDVRYLTTWQRGSAIRGRLYDPSFNPLTPNTLLASPGSAPDVDGDGTDFTVVFERQESGSTDRDIYCRAASFATGSLQFNGLARPVENDPDEDESRPFVSYLGPKSLVGWTNENGFLDASIGVIAIDPRSCEHCGNRISWDGNHPFDFGATAASSWSGGDDNADCVFAFGSAASAPPWSSDVQSAHFVAFDAGGVIQNLGGGCNGGGTCSISSIFALANTVDINLSGYDPNAFAGAMHISQPGLGSALCGTCNFIVPIVAVPVALTGGTVSMPLSIGCSADLIGAQFQFQFVLAGTSTSPCPIIQQVAVSNTVQAGIDV